ncbi:MAG: sugar transferase [Chloroflexota bacterium]|nr:sugar transferase [Chloroflexota bacterium]
MKFTPKSLLVLDALVVVAAFLLAFAVAIPFRYLERELPKYSGYLPYLLVLRLAAFALFGLYRSIWARAALRELVAVVSAVTTGSIVATLLLVFATLDTPIQIFPRRVLLFEWALTLAMVAGARYSLRSLDLRLLEPELEESDERHRRVLQERLGEWLLEAPPEVRAFWRESQNLSMKRFAKRTFDIVASLCALVALAPMLILIAALIKLESPGPVFADTPRRAGRGGTEFRMYKFRGMVRNAHLMLVNDPVLWEEYKKHNFKLLNDPRLTRVGRFIRQHSIDEFPNFINVLHGEMSMVGPRPRYPFEVVAQAEHFPHTQPDIVKTLSIKPGVTGPWQVSGRSNVGYEQRTHMEARYAETHTLWGDICIILKTIWVVVKREGAH